jgi:predicted RNA-binding protein associated with RNAse of E/G family
MGSVHAPKVETFDVPSGTNTDPKGFIRPVDEYRVEPFGLYVRREYQDHPRVSGIESWLLPDLDLRVTDWLWRPGHERDQDFYLDIMAIECTGQIWRTEDYYLDIIVRTGTSSTVVDVDEYVEAVAEGLLPASSAERALETSYRALNGLASHQHDVDSWLGTHGITLRWSSR